MGERYGRIDDAEKRHRASARVSVLGGHSQRQPFPEDRGGLYTRLPRGECFVELINEILNDSLQLSRRIQPEGIMPPVSI